MSRARAAALWAALAVVAWGPAQAQAAEWSDPGFYAGGWGGYTMPLDSGLEDPADPTFDLEISFDGGAAFAPLLGYRFGNGARLEAEVAFRSNDMDEASAGGLSAGVDGTIDSLAGMVSVLYDFGEGNVRPYLGVGAGYARVVVDSEDLGADEESDSVFAYQGRVGLGFLLGPNVLLSVGYGYFATTSPEFDGIEGEYRTHNLEVGFRVGF